VGSSSVEYLEKPVGAHGLDLVLAAILIAFFTAHKYMPKHYNENIVLYRNVATTTAIESGQRRENCGKNMKTFSMKINGQTLQNFGVRTAHAQKC